MVDEFDLVDPDDYYLTTVDNPWNPREDWDKWYDWDKAHGYNTPQYLARLMGVEPGDDAWTKDRKKELAVDDILTNNEDLYKIV